MASPSLKEDPLSQTPRITFIGFTNIDKNSTPQGETISPGGGAYFGAVVASLLLQPIGLVTRIGTDYDADFLLSRVLPDGVHVIQDKPTATSTQTYHSVDDLTDREVSLDWGVAPDICPEDIPPAWITDSDWIHISTMPPLQQFRFLRYLRDQQINIPISLDTDLCFLSDPQDIQQVQRNFPLADLGFVNRREYDKLQTVIDKMPEAIVKLDKDGAYHMREGKKDCEVKAEPVSVLDATGAGDILAGIYLATRVQGGTERESLQAGVSMASLSVTQVGITHLFHKNENLV
ncbi:MAG: carbohydrate kinase family protein [Candidatus Woesebacteria bacterium]